MSELATITPLLPSTSPGLIEKLKDIQDEFLKGDQAQIVTQHLLHAGMYVRTISMPPNLRLVGAHITRPTVVITAGNGAVLVGREWAHIAGFQVLPACADRKQIFVSLDGPLVISMFFPTNAKTVEEAEKAFTDEHELLLSRSQQEMNQVIITGVTE